MTYKKLMKLDPLYWYPIAVFDRNFNVVGWQWAGYTYTRRANAIRRAKIQAMMHL